MRRALRQQLISVDKAASALLFGNLAGLRWNVRGQRMLLAARRNGTDAARADAGDGVSGTQRDARKLRDVGTAILGAEAVPAAALAAVRAKLAQLIDDDGTSKPRIAGYWSKAERPYSRMLRNIGRDLPEAEALVSPAILDVVRAFYGSECRVTRVSSWRNYHVPRDVLDRSEVYSDHWHFDPKPTTRVQLFVYLSDVTVDDGPFNVLPRVRAAGYARRALRRFPRDRWQRVNETIDPAVVIQPTGPAGTAFLTMTSVCLHRATVPLEGRQRDVMRFDFEPHRQPLAPGWLRSFGENLELE